MKMRSHKDLDVWKRSMNLATGVYELTRTWPSNEQYGITSQVRRAAVSVPSNIAEGAARSSAKDFSRFIDIAQGSLAEVEAQLELAGRIGIIDGDSGLENEIISVRRMLGGLKKSLLRVPS